MLDNKSTCYKDEAYPSEYEKFSLIEQIFVFHLKEHSSILFSSLSSFSTKISKTLLQLLKLVLQVLLILLNLRFCIKLDLSLHQPLKSMEILVHPQVESYRGNVNPNGIRSCYDEGKRIAETLLYDFHRQHDLDLRVARIFNTYGPHMDPSDGRVVTNLILQALRKDELSIYGDGTQTRSFCFVDDMVDGLIKLSQSSSDCLWPVNLGNPTERTILDLAHNVKKLLPDAKELKFLELPQDDPIKRCPDISRAQKFLSWQPRISLHDGLSQMILFMQDIIT